MSQTVIAPPQPLVVTRTYPASRERVFQAWTEAGHLSRWFAPTDDYTTDAQSDLRIGGKYRLSVRHKGGNVHTMFGTYQVIEPPQKLVYTWNWEGATTPDSLVTVDFVALNGNSTQVTLTHQQFADVETRDKHSQGWNGCMDKLERYLATAS